MSSWRWQPLGFIDVLATLECNNLQTVTHGGRSISHFNPLFCMCLFQTSASQIWLFLRVPLKIGFQGFRAIFTYNFESIKGLVVWWLGSCICGQKVVDSNPSTATEMPLIKAPSPRAGCPMNGLNTENNSHCVCWAVVCSLVINGDVTWFCGYSL